MTMGDIRLMSTTFSVDSSQQSPLVARRLRPLRHFPYSDAFSSFSPFPVPLLKVVTRQYHLITEVGTAGTLWVGAGCRVQDPTQLNALW